jgi:hypothetical protein
MPAKKPTREPKEPKATPAKKPTREPKEPKATPAKKPTREPKEPKATPAKKKPVPPRAEHFESRQIDLFQRLLCNSPAERDSLSNVFDLWDGIPRYVVSRQQQDRWRKAGAFPLLHDVSFHYRGRELMATIQPAWIKDDDGNVTGYYPSASEELIEDVLRKIAAERNNGYYDQGEGRSGVVFTLYMVRKELERRGHGRTYKEIMLSLDIMSSAVIEIATADGREGEFNSKSLYLNNLFRVTKGRLSEDPEAKWFADFHPFASRALDQLTYRQFNYSRLMGHKSQLARWLNKVLSLKYLNASFVQPFEMRLSTIVRDSGLLSGYGRIRDAAAAVDTAFEELWDCDPPLLGDRPQKNVVAGERGKILDIIYTLRPSREFVAEVKAASKRRSLAEDQPDQPNPVDKPVER